MAYCTQDDILYLLNETALIQLTDDDGAGEIDDEKVTRAIADADAAIDAYCQDRYAVPLSPVPAKIRQISVDIAASLPEHERCSPADVSAFQQILLDRHYTAMLRKSKGSDILAACGQLSGAHTAG